jgi:predicted transcriptional regulator
MATQKMLVRLSPELKTQLEERSRKDRRTQSETLRIAIEQFVDADDREPVGCEGVLVPRSL